MNENSTFQLSSRRRFPYFKYTIPYYLKLHYFGVKNLYNYSDMSNDETYNVDSVSGAFMLFENKIVNDTILKKFNLLEHHAEYTNLAPVAMPVIGFVSKGIETKKSHNGIDIACTFNSEIHATQKGLIVFSDELKTLGKTIIIAHPNQFFSLYAHLNKSIVSAQTYVDKNQIIGFAGESGDSDGPHLHFEIWKNHNIIDPRNLIEEYRIKDVSIR